MQFIGLFDFALLPFYLFIIYRFALGFRDRNYPVGHSWRPYFIPALSLKIGGALFIGLIYQYYYGGGDTGYYFIQAKLVNGLIWESPVKWANLLLRIPDWYSGEYSDYISLLPYYGSTSSYAVVSITALVGLAGFNLYLPISVLFATLSFTGIWALFRTFATQYPRQTKYIAYACLFVPSTLVWGSGIFKDTICMFSLGWLTYSVFQVLIKRRLRFSHIVTILVCGYLIFTIKVYILLAFVPALVLWILFTYSHRIRASIIRMLVNTLLPVGLIALFIVVFNSYSDQLGKYSLDNLIQTSATTRDYIYRVSGDEGSAYSLGDIDPTPAGLLRKAPLAVNVSLFRPYVWEANKVIMLLSALESLALLLGTIYLLFTIGIVRINGIIRRNPTIQFCLIFAIVFAFSVGISSYNFGTLSRYRIPCLPFYTLALFLIYASYREPELALAEVVEAEEADVA